MEWAYKAKAQEPDKQKLAFLGVLGTEVAALAVGVRFARRVFDFTYFLRGVRPAESPCPVSVVALSIALILSTYFCCLWCDFGALRKAVRLCNAIG